MRASAGGDPARDGLRRALLLTYSWCAPRPAGTPAPRRPAARIPI